MKCPSCGRGGIYKLFEVADDSQDGIVECNRCGRTIATFEYAIQPPEEKKLTMYADCLNDRGVGSGGVLEVGKKYIVKEVKVIPGFGELIFYLLEDGLYYSSSHFSVTYLGRKDGGG